MSSPLPLCANLIPSIKTSLLVEDQEMENPSYTEPSRPTSTSRPFIWSFINQKTNPMILSFHWYNPIEPPPNLQLHSQKHRSTIMLLGLSWCMGHTTSMSLLCIHMPYHFQPTQYQSHLTQSHQCGWTSVIQTTHITLVWVYWSRPWSRMWTSVLPLLVLFLLPVWTLSRIRGGLELSSLDLSPRGSPVRL